MTKIIGVNPERVSGLQKDYSAKAHSAVQKKDEQFFDAMEAFLKADYSQKAKFIEEVLGKKTGESFVVGQVFQHRNKDLVPQYFGDNFKNWMWAPAQSRTIVVDVFRGVTPKEYILPKNMNDTAIQNANTSVPMEEDTFWAMHYLLIINPKLGKKILKYELRKDRYYICHVKLASGKVVAVNVYWDDDGWYCYANVFDYYTWNEGYVFLSLATL
ncbi:MAG: hypothetical protein NT068_01590 [Candidatus Nomurabacteria bacterium]|nr:hypothetical protein [Candidatus Nomurabacteria bacterium]